MKSAQIAVWFVLFTFTMDRAASQASDEADEYSDDRVHARLLALLQGCSEVCDTTIEGCLPSRVPCSIMAH
jgi:hypothetical protein